MAATRPRQAQVLNLSSDLDLKAPLASPVFTGTPSLPTGTTAATQSAGDNTTKLATTAHVLAERTNAATLTNKTLSSPVINTPTGLVKGDVGLGNVTNTSDDNKPVSIAQQAALDLKSNLASPVLTGTPTLPSGTIATTQSPGHNGTAVATTAFVTEAVGTAAAGVGKRSRVRAATTTNITIATALNDGDTLDGITLATGDLVLVKDQTAAEDNGVYVVGVSPARAGEFNTYNEHPASMIGVQEGTAGADTIWFCTANEGGTLGVTAIAFTKLGIGSDDLKANLASPTFTGTVTAPAIVLSSETESTIASFDGSKNIKSLATASYPSLVELARVKGLTNAIQAQLDAKSPLASPTFTGTVTAPALVLSSETASRIASFDGSSNVKALSTSTYPSLAELAHVKGVTSGIQAQIDAISGASGVALADHVFRETPNETPNDVITAFTVDAAMEAGTEQVFLNGILQDAGGEDYTLTNSTTFTFVAAPATGDRIRVNYIKA